MNKKHRFKAYDSIAIYCFKRRKRNLSAFYNITTINKSQSEKYFQ